MRPAQHLLGLAVLILLTVSACGSQESSAESTASAEKPVVVATTGILGDVVENLAAGQFEVITIMPVGADPHQFQPSAQDVAMIDKASAVVANGASFEEGLLDALHAAESSGAPVFEAITAIDPLDASGAAHDDDEHDDEAGQFDPHFFTDPARMAVVVREMSDFLIANLDGVDAEKLTTAAAQYIEELTSLDAEVEATLASVPDSRRVLVTNHQVFDYFADRYDFEVIGTVVPVGSSNEGVSGQRLAELTDLLEREGVSVVFTDFSSSDELAQTLADEVGNVDVVKLYTESLGEPGSAGATYVDMVRSNATEIAAALDD